jgi:23S rRNA (cytosine1962-C5)-methyltransferase
VYRRASFLTATNAVDDSSPFGPDVFGRDLSDPALGFSFSELNLAYEFVPPRRFGDPSLYLDFRPTRRWIRRFVAKRAAAGSSVSALNAFAYTCGAGLAATAGGASRVLNTDHSATYLAYGAANYKLNGFEAGDQEGQGPRESESESTTQKTQTPKAEYSTSTRNARGAFDAYCEDFYPAVRQLAGLPMPGRQGRGGGRGGSKRGSKRGGRGAFGSSSPKEKKAKPPRPETFDLVILDPPTLTKTAYGAVDIENDYQSLAKPCGLCVTPGGVLLATNHSHRIDVDDWLELVEKCVTKAGCVLTNVEVVSPDADDDDHPAMSDGKRPLKVAAFTLE